MLQFIWPIRGANAVIHVHSIELWNELIYKVPTTNPSMDYGTTGLAKDIFRLFSESDVIEKRIIIMAGDRAGILTSATIWTKQSTS